jgi:hypothetical protein
MTDARSAGDPSSHSGQGTKPPNNRPGRGRFSNVAYASVPIRGIIGHRQVTEAYIAQARASRLAAFDQAMAKLRSDVVDLVPDSLRLRSYPGTEKSHVGSDQ